VVNSFIGGGARIPGKTTDKLYDIIILEIFPV
jgi:hypothetical protein